MRKLIDGIVDFRKKLRPEYRERFRQLALGQSPDTLFVACSDSRVVPNLFASTEPGDLFVVRNVGNLIPPCGINDFTTGDESEIAAIEFAMLNLKVDNIIVCGHSECGAMQALVKGRDKIEEKHLQAWLRHSDPVLEGLASPKIKGDGLAKHNLASQLNVLLQMENLLSYPIVRKKVENGSIQVHGWWFDIAQADVYAYEEDKKAFVLIDELEASKISRKLSPKPNNPTKF